MPAGMDDILTTQKNGVIAINNLDQDIKGIATSISAIVSANTAFVPQYVTTPVVGTTAQSYVGKGRIVAVSIPVHSGSGQAYIYDCTTTAAQSNSNLIFATLASNASSFTPYQTVNLPFNSGISLKADAGVSVLVAYRTDQ